jgi:hypothetical protein
VSTESGQAHYDQGELKLVRSPDKTILFHTRDLTDGDLAKIVEDIAAKVDKRLAGFEAFVELIDAGADPSAAVRDRFGS